MWHIMISNATCASGLGSVRFSDWGQSGNPLGFLGLFGHPVVTLNPLWGHLFTTLAYPSNILAQSWDPRFTLASPSQSQTNPKPSPRPSQALDWAWLGLGLAWVWTDMQDCVASNSFHRRRHRRPRNWARSLLENIADSARTWRL